jgi:plasmid stabilization system protein ParE
VTAKRSPRIVWTVTAEEDLWGIVEFISGDDVPAALDVLRRLREHAAVLDKFPGRGRIVPELDQHGIRQYRELVMAPWRIVYRVDGAVVYVMAVLDSRRNLEDLLLERLSRP